MFTDTAGTTPVTTPGQTVALLLDKSKGLTLGSELVTNGDFSGGTTGWEGVGGTISAVSGRLRVAYSTANPFGRQGVSCVVGNTYLLTGQYFGGTETTRLYVGDSNTGANPQGVIDFSGDGSATVRFKATATTMWIIATGRGLATGEFVEFDNISVKELPGNHATQATTASRPTYGIVPLGGRRNLLLQTEAFNVLPWTLTNASLSAGASSESRIVTATANTASIQQFTTVTAGTYTNSIQIRRVTGTGNIIFRLPSASQPAPITVTSSWATFSTTGASGSSVNYFVLDIATSGDAVEIRYPQIELGSTATAYQRVTTQYDVTETGVQSLSYLSFDGVDDFMLTGTITAGVDKAQVFAGYRIASGTSSQILLETSSNSSINAGSFALAQGPAAANTGFGAIMNAGVNNIAAQTATLTVPYSSVATLQLNSALVGITNEISLRMNGVAMSLPTIFGTDTGTGNFGSYPLYIGRRAGTSIPFNGNFYSILVRFGANLDAGTITSTETFVAGKTGVTL
jgi:hypothetical protein